MADDSSPLASLSLTHVYYDPSDPVSYLCAWLALTPQILCVVYVTLLWSTREAEVALLFAGQMACEAVNFLLKRLIQEERPKRIASHGTGYGMPSSHAQFVAFWAVALGLFLLARHRPRGRSGAAAKGDVGLLGPDNGDGERPARSKKGREGQTNGTAGRFSALVADTQALADNLAILYADPHRPWAWWERAVVSAAAVVLAGLVAWSRVYLGYHTAKQVLAGCLAGAISAAGWFGVTFVARQTGLLAWGLDLPVARWLRVRDLVVEEDLAQAGWEKWEERRRRMGQKEKDKRI